MRLEILKEMKGLILKIAALHAAGLVFETTDLVRRLDSLARRANFPTPAEVQAA